MEGNLQDTLGTEVVQLNKPGRNTGNLRGKGMYWQVRSYLWSAQCQLCKSGNYNFRNWFPSLTEIMASFI